MIIRRFINQLMQSNCYVLSKNGRCIIVDPASEKSEDVIQFVEDENLVPDFIILTHEHSDHTWGVNALLEYCPSIRVLTCKACTIELPKAWQSYFKFYYDDPEYSYYVERVDVTAEELESHLEWEDEMFEFMYTPGHSRGSMCFRVGNKLFSGDTLMMSKPFLNKRDGNREDYQKSIAKLLMWVDELTEVYPGHGDVFVVKDYLDKK